MNTPSPWLNSPVIPAILLLFGLIFAFALFHIAGISWIPGLARFHFVFILFWGVLIIIQRKDFLLNFGLIDYFLLIFLTILVISLVVHRADGPAILYYGGLIPFLILLPYCLGKIIKKHEFEIFLRVLPWLGLLVLALCVVDFWGAPENEIVTSRWRFFGVNHSPLQIATLVSCSLLSVVYVFITSSEQKTNIKIITLWIVIAIFAVALVLIAARGFLIVSALVLLVMLCLINDQNSKLKFAVLGSFIIGVSAGFCVLPKPQTDFYKRMSKSYDASLLNSTLPEYGDLVDKIKSKPRCRVLIESINSIAIRRLLYVEAIELFAWHPWTGIGAAGFGYYSCAGPGSYPHSSLLQSFAELGLLGGMPFLMLYMVSIITLAWVYFRSLSNERESVFWICLLCFFALSDQVYGNYFMAPGSFFMFGVASRFSTQHKVILSLV